ncbi:MAG: glucan endo,6-beta-glucosidase [Mucilaginibacter sp.]|nr:glucan endo,6-beta-glucosidase [Mucilaginibacter sp.]
MKTNYKLKLLAVLLMLPVFLYFSCKKDLSNTSDKGVSNKTIGRAANEVVNLWVTSGDQSKLLKQQPSINFAADAGTNKTTVTVDENTTYQGIDGFGYCLTGGSATLINQLSSAQGDSLLHELFLTGTNQIGVSYLRISMGASDLSASDFTYDEVPAGQTDLSLTNFSISQELTDLVPLLKRIIALNPAIKIIATPWTPPTWMKSNKSFIGGRLNTAYYDVYAKYFVKYIQAMKAQGITIDAVTPQNEPLNPNNNPSLLMYAGEETNFIKNNLGPQFQTNSITTKIIAYDHNCDHPDYPDSVLADANANPYVNGSAFHLYSGAITALSTVHTNYPTKSLYFTEQYTSSTGSFSGDLSWHVNNLIIGAPRNWSRNVLEWNLASDPNYGPHTSGGCTTCKGALTIGGTSITRNVSYYIIAHASKFVSPGAVRISSNTFSGGIQDVAFKNADGSKVVIALNTGHTSQTFKLKWGSESFSYTLPVGSVVSFKWSGTQL